MNPPRSFIFPPRLPGGTSGLPPFIDRAFIGPTKSAMFRSISLNKK